ncbi:MAG: TolC family protein [Sphingomonadaceae bacterium]
MPASRFLLLALALCLGTVAQAASVPSDPRRLLPPVTPALDSIAGSGGQGCDALGAAALAGRSLAVADWADLALCRNPQTRAAWAGYRVSSANFGIARAEQLPSVGLNAGGAIGGAQFLNAPGSQFAKTQSGFASIAISWLLYDFGGRSARIAAADAEVAASFAAFADIAQDIVLQTAVAANRLIALQAAFEAAEANRESAAAAFDAASERERVGTGLKADRLQAEAALAEAELVKRRVEGDVRIARATLAVVSGLPPTAPARVERPVALPGPEELARDAEDLIRAAERLRPDIRQRLANLAGAEAAIAATRANLRPSLGLTSNSSIRYDDRGFDTVGTNIGIALNFPIFEGFQRRYALRRAEAERDRQEALLEATRQSAGLDVFAARENLETEAANLSTARRRLASAEEAAELALGRYRAGIGAIVDLLNAQASLAAARRELVAAEFEVRTRRVELARAIGTVDEVLQ